MLDISAILFLKSWGVCSPNDYSVVQSPTEALPCSWSDPSGFISAPDIDSKNCVDPESA